jgi:hypothetical protein
MTSDSETYSVTFTGLDETQHPARLPNPAERVASGPGREHKGESGEIDQSTTNAADGCDRYYPAIRGVLLLGRQPCVCRRPELDLGGGPA